MSKSYDRISIYGLLQWDPTLFANFQLPNDLVSQKEDIINNILLECYELECLYPDPGIMKINIGLWSKKMLPSWERMLLALTETYNPLHNFDRHEDYTDTSAGTSNASGSVNTSESDQSTSNSSEMANASGSNNSSNTTNNSVNGYNLSEGWADHDKSISSGSDTSASTSSGSSTGSTNGSRTGSSVNASTTNDTKNAEHIGHLYGNIGVTKSQEMLEDEINVRMKYNIIDLITKSFRDHFCVLVY